MPMATGANVMPATGGKSSSAFMSAVKVGTLRRHGVTSSTVGK